MQVLQHIVNMSCPCLSFLISVVVYGIFLVYVNPCKFLIVLFVFIKKKDWDHINLQWKPYNIAIWPHCDILYIKIRTDDYLGLSAEM